MFHDQYAFGDVNLHNHLDWEFFFYFLLVWGGMSVRMCNVGVQLHTASEYCLNEKETVVHLK